MRERRRGFLALLLAVLLTAGAGCGSAGGDRAQNAETAEKSVQAGQKEDSGTDETAQAEGTLEEQERWKESRFESITAMTRRKISASIRL